MRYYSAVIAFRDPLNIEISPYVVLNLRINAPRNIVEAMIVIDKAINRTTDIQDFLDANRLTHLTLNDVVAIEINELDDFPEAFITKIEIED